MSLAAAVPFGVGSAPVYGISIVVQHRVAQQEADHEGASAAGLLRLIKHPVFLLAIAGDAVGFLLQIVALSLGSVVVIQPLVVLMLPVSLLVTSLTGGPRPRYGDYLGVLGVVGGLAVFLALIGHPHFGRVPHAHILGLAIVCVLVAGVLICLAATGRNKTIRGAVYGAVAGAYFGTLAVMIDAASDRVSRDGVAALFTSARGIVPLAGMLVCGVGAMILTQMSFQTGALGATLPASLATDPLTAVIVGAILLREHIPFDAVHLVLYILCVAAVLAGAIRLAAPHEEPHAATESPPIESLAAPEGLAAGCETDGEMARGARHDARTERG